MLRAKDRNENGLAVRASEHERLISEHVPLIRLHASRLASQLFSAQVATHLIDAGVIALMEAVASYREKSEAGFKTYADRCIRTAMSAEVRRLNGTDCQIGPISRKPSKASEKLRPKMRHETRDVELALALGIDVERLASFELIAQISGLSVGGFSEVSRKDDQVEAEEKLVGYYSEHHSDRPSCVVEKGRLLQILAQAVNALSPNERLVISLHYVEELTVKEIATILRMGEWRVLQLHTKAVLRLRTRLRCQLGPA